MNLLTPLRLGKQINDFLADEFSWLISKLVVVAR